MTAVVVVVVVMVFDIEVLLGDVTAFGSAGTSDFVGTVVAFIARHKFILYVTGSVMFASTKR